jgi:inosose dehydratase
MVCKIGINPITWSNDDDPKLGGDTPLEVCLDETRQAGYQGTELGGKFPRHSSILGPILKRHELQLVSGWFDGHLLERSIEEEFAAILPHITLLKDLGCRHAVYADQSRGRLGAIFDPISKRPKLLADEWKDYGIKITKLAEKMTAFGVGLAFHHHMGTFVETDAEVDALMEHTGPAVGLLFDTGHCLFSGGDPKVQLQRHLKRVVHFHCKDVRPAIMAKARANDWSFMGAVLEGIFTVPGDGAVDYPTLLKILHDGGYAGWLVVEAEQDPAKAHPLTYATMGYRNLYRLATSAGFTIDGLPPK